MTASPVKRHDAERKPEEDSQSAVGGYQLPDNRRPAKWTDTVWLVWYYLAIGGGLSVRSALSGFCYRLVSITCLNETVTPRPSAFSALFSMKGGCALC